MNSRAGRLAELGGIGIAMSFLFVLSILAAWITHVVWIIQILMSGVNPTAGQMALGIIGAIAPPIGVIHGFVLWFT